MITREVSKEEAQEFMRRHGIKHWSEISAKLGLNIDKLFLEASKFLYANHHST